MRRTIAALTLASTLASAALAAPPAPLPSPATIARIEKVVRLPDHRWATDYERYYTSVRIGGRVVVRGAYHLVTRGAAHAPPGKTHVHIVAPNDFHDVMDGGCGFVDIYYDPAKPNVVEAGCHGLG